MLRIVPATIQDRAACVLPAEFFECDTVRKAGHATQPAGLAAVFATAEAAPALTARNQPDDSNRRRPCSSNHHQ